MLSSGCSKPEVITTSAITISLTQITGIATRGVVVADFVFGGWAMNIKLFEYQKKQVRTVLVKKRVWFVAKDVCDVLGLGNVSQALSSLDDDEKNTIILNEGIRGNPTISIISESGMYSLVLSSRKPEAKAFKKWITSEVLPQIRETGRYVPKHQGVLPGEAHTQIEVQKDMSRSVNALNFDSGGKEKTIEYNVQNCIAHTGKHPTQVKALGKKQGLKSKDCSSAKAVLRVTQPEVACAMSLADNLVEQGHSPERVFEVTKKATELFAGMLELGAIPAELNQ